MYKCYGPHMYKCYGPHMYKCDCLICINVTALIYKL